MTPDACLPDSSQFDQQTLTDRRTFFPVQVVGVIYVMTLLVYVSALFGDPEQPIDHHPRQALQQSILSHGLTVILAETALLAAVSFRAMAQDRRQTLDLLQTARKGIASSPKELDQAAG